MLSTILRFSSSVNWAQPMKIGCLGDHFIGGNLTYFECVDFTLKFGQSAARDRSVLLGVCRVSEPSGVIYRTGELIDFAHFGSDFVDCFVWDSK